ncbi:hypothetical protein ES707_16408 [subsurface metagenome]
MANKITVGVLIPQEWRCLVEISSLWGNKCVSCRLKPLNSFSVIFVSVKSNLQSLNQRPRIKSFLGSSLAIGDYKLSIFLLNPHKPSLFHPFPDSRIYNRLVVLRFNPFGDDRGHRFRIFFWLFFCLFLLSSSFYFTGDAFYPYATFF